MLIRMKMMMMVCVCVLPEHGCQRGAQRVPTPKTFFSCEDSHSSVLSAVALALAKVPSHPNYLAVFIIQRLRWRQTLGIPKENCFHTYKWKVAGHWQCNPLSFWRGVEIESTTSSPAFWISVSVSFLI